MKDDINYKMTVLALQPLDQNQAILREGKKERTRSNGEYSIR